MVMMVGDPRDGGYDGGGGVMRPRVPPPPAAPPPPIPPPTWQPPPTVKPPTTGGPTPPTPVTPAPGTPAVTTLRTGGPQPPVPVQKPLTAVTYPGQQPVPAGPGAVPAQANASPISVMDWRSRLAQGDENAVNRTVGANETVAHQMDQLADSGSRYINQARDHAREEASARGMMMSSTAVGAGERAAIDASLPIAQQDAQTYGRTASENMAATNADRMQDQSVWGQLTGQEVGIKANLDESERARGFSALENQRNRQFTEHERVSTQNWQTAQNNAGLQQQLRQQEIQIAHDAAMQSLNRSTQLTMQDKQYLQERFNQYQTAMNNQSALLSQTIASIYNNPNLNATQQAAAVANAQAVYQSIFKSYAAAMSGGLPQIFYQPYPMK